MIILPSAVKGLKFLNETETINKYVKELKDKGVKTIVVLIHNGGVSQNKTLYNEQLDMTNSSHILDVVKHADPAVAVYSSPATRIRPTTLLSMGAD